MDLILTSSGPRAVAGPRTLANHEAARYTAAAMTPPQSTETLRVVNQFDTAREAQRYSNEFNTHRQQRSKNSLLAALKQVPEGSSVLDLPCGSGRLISLLLSQGYRYRGADVFRPYG